MKKNIKNLLLIMIVLLGVFTLAGCGNKYKYPSETPEVTNPKEVVLTIGDYKVTKEQMYYRNLTSYGVDVLNSLIDDALLPKFESLTAEEKADYEDYKNEKIYLTTDLEKLDAEEKADAEKTFKKSQVLNGNYTDAEIEAALKLEYRRFVFASKEMKEEMENFEPVTNDDGEVIQEEYFTETEIKNAIATVYPTESTIILLTFRSELEAKSLLEAVGIYADQYDYRGWHKLVKDAEGNKEAGELLTQTEVYDAFIEMYNTLYGHMGCSIKENAYKAEGNKYVWDLQENANGYNNFKYTYNQLSAISSTIAKKVFDTLTTENFSSSYTIAPNKYLTKYFLAIEVEEKEAVGITSSDKDVEKQLIKSKLSDALINNYLYEKRIDSDLVIYDRGLEILYADAYNAVVSSLSIDKTYEKTSLTSKTNVATLDVDGKAVAITADDLSDAMNAKYGVSTGIGFAGQAILLADAKYSKVFDIVTGEILDQEAYDKLYEEEIASYKEELEAGTFATLGYPKGYGWENFLRDRLGVLSELELLALGSVYDDALTALGETTYTFSNDASIAINGLFTKVLLGELSREAYEQQIAGYVEAAENTIQYQMQKVVDEYYNLNAYSIRVYTDLDHNGAADELTDEAKAYAEVLINYFIAEGTNTSVAGKTYAERIATLVKEYNLAAYNDMTKVGNVTFAELKEAGIEVTLSTATTYSSKTENDEEFGKVLKGLWNQVKDGKIAEKTFTSTTKTVKFEDELVSDFYTTEYAVSKVVVTEANDYTYIVNNTKVKQVLPTEELIDRYLIVNKEDEDKTDEELKLSVSTKEKAAIEAYYKVAMNEFTSEEALGEALIAVREDLFEKGTMKFADSSLNDKYSIFMDLVE